MSSELKSDIQTPEKFFSNKKIYNQNTYFFYINIIDNLHLWKNLK